jgi:hypothetical protein
VGGGGRAGGRAGWGAAGRLPHCFRSGAAEVAFSQQALANACSLHTHARSRETPLKSYAPRRARTPPPPLCPRPRSRRRRRRGRRGRPGARGGAAGLQDHSLCGAPSPDRAPRRGAAPAAAAAAADRQGAEEAADAAAAGAGKGKAGARQVGGRGEGAAAGSGRGAPQSFRARCWRRRGQAAPPTPLAQPPHASPLPLTRPGGDTPHRPAPAPQAGPAGGAQAQGQDLKPHARPRRRVGSRPHRR